eukprot:3615365-Amphidinium_carterae.2
MPRATYGTFELAVGNLGHCMRNLKYANSTTTSSPQCESVFQLSCRQDKRLLEGSFNSARGVSLRVNQHALCLDQCQRLVITITNFSKSPTLFYTKTEFQVSVRVSRCSGRMASRTLVTGRTSAH